MFIWKMPCIQYKPAQHAGTARCIFEKCPVHTYIIAFLWQITPYAINLCVLLKKTLYITQQSMLAQLGVFLKKCSAYQYFLAKKHLLPIINHIKSKTIYWQFSWIQMHMYWQEWIIEKCNTMMNSLMNRHGTIRIARFWAVFIWGPWLELTRKTMHHEFIHKHDVCNIRKVIKNNELMYMIYLFNVIWKSIS